MTQLSQHMSVSLKDVTVHEMGKKRMMLVYGGAACGKSAFAEDICVTASACDEHQHPLIYCATMESASAEARERIAKHRLARTHKGFLTCECSQDISLHLGDIEDGSVVLLEDIGNLVAHALFSPRETPPCPEQGTGACHLGQIPAPACPSEEHPALTRHPEERPAPPCHPEEQAQRSDEGSPIEQIQQRAPLDASLTRANFRKEKHPAKVDLAFRFGLTSPCAPLDLPMASTCPPEERLAPPHLPEERPAPPCHPEERLAPPCHPEERSDEGSRAFPATLHTQVPQCCAPYRARYQPRQADAAIAQQVCEEVSALCRRVATLVVVSVDVGSDTGGYGEDTERYRRVISQVNAQLAAYADAVVEIVCGIPIWLKGDAQSWMGNAASAPACCTMRHGINGAPENASSRSVL